MERLKQILDVHTITLVNKYKDQPVDIPVGFINISLPLINPKEDLNKEIAQINKIAENYSFEKQKLCALTNNGLIWTLDARQHLVIINDDACEDLGFAIIKFKAKLNVDKIEFDVDILKKDE